MSNERTYPPLKRLRIRIAQSFQWSGVNRLARKFKTGAVILYYHGVEAEIFDPQVQPIHLPFALFEKQVDYLRKNFDIISLPYLLDCFKNGYRLDPLSVLITFDDGYKNNREIVWPFLSSLEIPFSVFISTRHIEEGIRFPTYYLRAALFSSESTSLHVRGINESFDISTWEKRVKAKNYLEVLIKNSPQHVVAQVIQELKGSIPGERWAEINGRFHSDQPMTWDDVKHLSDSGVAIGSHCHDHFILHSQQSRSEIHHQIATSKGLIETKVGPCVYLSYPEGGSSGLDASVLGAMADCHYELGFTSVGGEIREGLNPFLLPRLGTSPQFDHFRFNLNTSFRFNGSFRRWSRQFFEASESEMVRPELS